MKTIHKILKANTRLGLLGATLLSSLFVQMGQFSIGAQIKTLGYDLDVTGYSDGGTLSISLFGTDRDENGLLEINDYSAIYETRRGSITHDFNDLDEMRDPYFFRFDRSSPSFDILDFELVSHKSKSSFDQIYLKFNSLNGEYSSFNFDDRNPYLADSCGPASDGNISQCSVQVQARQVNLDI